MSSGAEVVRWAAFVVGPGRGPRGRGKAGRTGREESGEEAAAGAGAESGIRSVVPPRAGPAAVPCSQACAHRRIWVPQAEAPAAAGGQWGGRREDRRVQAPCARSRREAAGGRDAMSMEDPFFVVKG